MFSVKMSVVLLVVFVSQGQTSTITAATAILSSATVLPGLNASASTPKSLSTVSSEVPSKSSGLVTCVKLGVTLDLLWDKDYENKSSEQYKNISTTFVSALEMLYNDQAKYKDVNVSEVKIENKDDKVYVEAILCLIVVGDKVIVVVFRNKVETGTLSEYLIVVKDSAEVEPQGVSLTEWKAKEGECDKCDGAAGPFEIVRECEEEKYSCKGQEKTKETDDCTTYCSATVAVTVSSVILAIGIFLSSSFQ